MGKKNQTIYQKATKTLRNSTFGRVLGFSMRNPAEMDSTEMKDNLIEAFGMTAYFFILFGAVTGCSMVASALFPYVTTFVPHPAIAYPIVFVITFIVVTMIDGNISVLAPFVANSYFSERYSFAFKFFITLLLSGLASMTFYLTWNGQESNVVQKVDAKHGDYEYSYSALVAQQDKEISSIKKEYAKKKSDIIIANEEKKKLLMHKGHLKVEAARIKYHKYKGFPAYNKRVTEAKQDSLKMMEGFSPIGKNLDAELESKIYECKEKHRGIMEAEKAALDSHNSKKAQESYFTLLVMKKLAAFATIIGILFHIIIAWLKK